MTGCGLLPDLSPVPQANETALGVRSLPQPESAAEREERRKAQRLLARGEAALGKGAVEAAIAAAGQVFSCCEKQFPERTLRLLSGALAQREERQRSDVVRRFLQLEAAYPGTVYGPAASCWTAALLEGLARDDSLARLRQTARSQKSRIQTLEEKIEQLKAVDLELTTPGKAGEVP